MDKPMTNPDEIKIMLEQARQDYGEVRGNIQWVNHSKGYLPEIPAKELNQSHPLWSEAAIVINELAPVTRRDDWWGTEGPRIIIYRALLSAQKCMDEERRKLQQAEQAGRYGLMLGRARTG